MKKGFTLVEFIIVVAIISALVVGDFLCVLLTLAAWDYIQSGGALC